MQWQETVHTRLWQASWAKDDAGNQPEEEVVLVEEENSKKLGRTPKMPYNLRTKHNMDKWWNRPSSSTSEDDGDDEDEDGLRSCTKSSTKKGHAQEEVLPRSSSGAHAKERRKTPSQRKLRAKAGAGAGLR